MHFKKIHYGGIMEVIIKRTKTNEGHREGGFYSIF